MKKLIIALSLLFLIQNSFAQQYKYDTVFTKQVGMGIKYTKFVTLSVPWEMYVLEVDLTNKYTSIESLKGKDNIVGRETLSSMVARKSAPGHRVIGIVNADFFDLGSGTPINIQIENGQILRDPINLSTIGFDINKKPMLARVTMSGSLITSNGTFAISNVNDTRNADQMIMYNQLFGASTKTNVYGAEVLLEPIDAWAVNDTIRCVVTKKVNGAGNMAYSGNQVVISGHGKAQTFLVDNVKIGDTVKVVNSITPGLNKLMTLLGGYPKIVSQGKNYADQGYAEEGGPDHTYLFEPRTAAGFSKDSTKLYLIAVDGREDASAGMTLPQLADFMIFLGVSEGLNFDGGGSTEMMVRNAIVNDPSDGGERAISNALLVISSAPDNGTLKSIKLNPGALKLFKNGAQSFSIDGLDEYFNPITINASQAVFSVDKQLGSITKEGVFTAGSKADTGYLYVSYNGLKDSVLIIVKSLDSINVQPKNAVTNMVRAQKFRLSMFDFDKVSYNLPNSDFTWKVLDTSIGTIDSTGVFYGKKPGTTKVIVTYEGLADTANITVQSATGMMMVNGFEDLAAFTVSGENVDASGTKISLTNQEFSQGTSSLKIDYKFNGNPTVNNWVYINCNIPLYGVPDSIKIDGKSDGQKHVLYYTLSDENNELFTLATNKYMDVSTSFDTLRACIFKAAPVVTYSVFDYPASIKQIKIKLGSARTSGQVYSGTLYLDNLRITYPSAITGVNYQQNIPLSFSLKQNYPNPFNPSTTIEFTTEKSGFAELKIYDVLGREVESLVKGNLDKGVHKVMWNAAGCTSGVYFYELRVNEQKSIKKMLLLR